jgi:hypothetical protein
MLALPVGFLPFDPNRDNKDSDDEDEDEDESCPESDEESSEDTLHDSISNGENNHEQKPARHIGGGVLLVRIIFYIHDSGDICFCCDRVQQVNVFLLQC